LPSIYVAMPTGGRHTTKYIFANFSHNVDFTLTCACGCKVFCISAIAFYTKRMCPQRLPEEHQTSVPLVRRRHLWRAGPSTRPNAVVAAQRVKFVLCRCRQAVAWGQGCGVFAKPALYLTRRQRFNESGVRELSVISAAYE
jgi:hypothetical protein